ncbi:chemotaxis protein CheW [Aphanothece hegewaldii CCALA 016]|uniref:Chemotaxis protein CheW n=1 Tax=Aphanothece hegewaldii CCALA 016 TaxID=2107694 RepID=A0A2T1LZY5_9CHRO|nr:chemotaxis protein CheW [Aphanothece hegewaldii]PSF37947.1 chemotaxis protein CheW [Aphanothece hegewaldii CCALA 016]
MNDLIIQTPNIQLDSYLKVQLNSSTIAAIATSQIQEAIISTKEKITPIPNMPNCVLGLVNQRNRIYWVVDLAQLLQITTIKSETREYNLIFVRDSDVILGLAVTAIQEVTKFAIEQIQSPLNIVSSGIVPYLKGIITEEQNNLLVLDVSAIINSPQLHET